MNYVQTLDKNIEKQQHILQQTNRQKKYHMRHNQTQQNQLQYNQSQHDQLQYNQSQHDQLQYNQSQYDQLQYNQSQYDQLQHSQIHHDQSQHNQRQHNQTKQPHQQNRQHKHQYLLFFQKYFPLILFSLLEIAIFFCIFCLYQLEPEAFLYAAGLYLTALLCYLIYCFFREQQRHHMRQQQLSSINCSWAELDPPTSQESFDLQEMIRALGQQCNELTTKLQSAKQESLDYYTTWVHQIKTPISVMQMILQSEDTPDHRELSAELFRIEQYVEMVLTYIRLGSDDHDFVFREYDLDALVRQSIRKYAPQFIRRKIRLVYKPTELTVLTDEKWLTFILEQLLSNAVKYTPQGSVTITVTPDKKLYVSDTGIGISPEDLPRIFEKGFTGYNGRADKKSTGLGLYLCRQTADKLGIGIMADSTPGKGSVFTLDLSTRRLEVE